MEIFIGCFAIKIGVWQNGDSRAGTQNVSKTTSSYILQQESGTRQDFRRKVLCIRVLKNLRPVSFHFIFYYAVFVQKASFSHL